MDKIIARHLRLGRRRVGELFARGAVRVQGRPAAKGVLGRAGQEVSVSFSPDEGPLPEPDAPLCVRLQTDGVVVVDKPAGQAAAALRSGERGTLAGALLGHYPEMKYVGYSVREPGLVHRLDTRTSGLLVAARAVDAFVTLREALARGALAKHYLAVVPAGDLPRAGEMTTWLAPAHRGSTRVAVAASPLALRGARRATTRWRVLQTAGPWQLVEVVAPHAYRHQVRAHLAALGFPIAGDELYGGSPVQRLGARHALHASYVAWAGDATLPSFEVASMLPREMVQLLHPG
ncbi:MAG: RluA family pseudouridine synthase [Polyangiaceae bacterium]|nr:RluA family pseudouridine synthase [Polyangiaceae bacterium]